MGHPPPPGPVGYDAPRPTLPAGPFHVICYWLLWAMIAGLPVIVLGIRSVTETFGWLSMAYLMFGIFGNVVVQSILASAAAAHARSWSPRAMGTRAAVASLVYYASWAGLALSLNDFGDSGPGARSWMTGILGPEGANVMVWVFIVLGVTSLLATFVFVVLDGGAARRASTTPGAGR